MGRVGGRESEWAPEVLPWMEMGSQSGSVVKVFIGMNVVRKKSDWRIDSLFGASGICLPGGWRGGGEGGWWCVLFT